GRQSDGCIQDIAGFDTEELRPFAVAQVCQMPCAFAPRIPHNRSKGIGLLQSNATAKLRIGQINVVLSADKGIISCRGNRHVTMLYLCPVRMGVVEELGSVQTLQPHVRDVGYTVVCVEGFFETQIVLAGVDAGELEGEFGTKGNTIHEAKLRGPPALSLFVTLGRHAHGDSGFVFNNRLDLPTLCAHKSMRGRSRIVCLGAKPRKANRDSSADCLAFLPARSCAEKEKFVAPSRLPGGHLRAVDIDLAFGPR